MAIKRIIECDLCHTTQMEPEANAGWIGWGALQGIKLNNVDNPNFCPECLGRVAVAIDALATPTASATSPLKVESSKE